MSQCRYYQWQWRFWRFIWCVCGVEDRCEKMLTWVNLITLLCVCNKKRLLFACQSAWNAEVKVILSTLFWYDRADNVDLLTKIGILLIHLALTRYNFSTFKGNCIWRNSFKGNFTRTSFVLFFNFKAVWKKLLQNRLKIIGDESAFWMKVVIRQLCCRTNCLSIGFPPEMQKRQIRVISTAFKVNPRRLSMIRNRFVCIHEMKEFQ